jgi:hypothetical protein
MMKERPDERRTSNMANAFTTTGTLADDMTVSLDERLPLGSARVRVTLEVLESAAGEPRLDAVLRQIRARQAARGYKPPTRAEVDAYLAEERETWGD